MMMHMNLEKAFEQMGARVNVRESREPEVVVRRRVRAGQPPPPPTVRLNVLTDKKGEVFDIQMGEGAELRVLQVNRPDKHLLLYSTDGQRFLCGHDERHWFVAGVSKPVSTVVDAKLSLKPEALADVEKKVGRKAALKRRNAAFKRQGEWFFTPVNRDFHGEHVYKNDPLTRPGGGSPHKCQELVRFGGEPVRVVNGVEYSEKAWANLAADDPIKTGGKGRINFFTKNPEVYVRGRISHRDHATLLLKTWHRVHISSEMRTSGVAFYD